MDRVHNHGMTFPSKNHSELVEHIHAVCLRMDYSLAIMGSVAKGTATRYSDLDVLLFGPTDGFNVDPIIEFGKPLMVNLTVRPPGIVIACFPLGLCVDLDIRKNATNRELEDSVVLLDRGISRTMANVERISVHSRYLNVNPLHGNLRLLHRAILKYLCQKTDSADELLGELNVANAAFGIEPFPLSGSFAQDARSIYLRMSSKNSIEDGLNSEFLYLLHESEHA